MNAEKTLVGVIYNKVTTMNAIRKLKGCEETLERYRHELNGMLVCLRHIADPEKIYGISYNDDGSIEFGYDTRNNDKWTVISD